MITANCEISPEQVARHYDELDRFYRSIWGHHVHHGLWRTGKESPQQAVEQLIETVLQSLEVTDETRVCDVGCGYGGTSRYIAEKFAAPVVGMTLSPAQYEFATLAGQGKANPQFELGDWTANSFESSSFDAVVSIECLAHIVDKDAFFAQIDRVLRPGGRAVVTAWLEGDQYGTWHKKRLLEPICREGRLPSMGTKSEYAEMAQRAGLEMIQFQDLTEQVRRTWRICSRRILAHMATRPDAWWHVVRRRSSSWVFLFSIWRIRLAYRTGAMRYGLFVLEKKR